MWLRSPAWPLFREGERGVSRPSSVPRTHRTQERRMDGQRARVARQKWTWGAAERRSAFLGHPLKNVIHYLQQLAGGLSDTATLLCPMIFLQCDGGIPGGLCLLPLILGGLKDVSCCGCQELVTGTAHAHAAATGQQTGSHRDMPRAALVAKAMAVVPADSQLRSQVCEPCSSRRVLRPRGLRHL